MNKNAFNIIKDAVDTGKIPGAAYAIVIGRDIELNSYGYMEVEPNKIENSNHTLYDMASCSKVVATTTMILKLIEEGTISLDDDVRLHLDNFPYEGITIKHLLTHTAGLYPDDKRYKECKSKEDFINFVYSLDLLHKIGECVDYSDFGFNMLGWIIEKYKGSLEAYLNEVLLQPLGMYNTIYNPYLIGRENDCATAEVTTNRGVIKGIVHDGKAYCLNGLSGNAGLFSNIEDLAKFVTMMLNDGKGVFKKETIDLLKHSYTEGLNKSRTLGWIFSDPNETCGEYASKCSLYHTGFSGTSIYIDYERNCAIVLLTNRVHPTRNNPTIMDIRRDFHAAVLKEL